MISAKDAYELAKNVKESSLQFILSFDEMYEAIKAACEIGEFSLEWNIILENPITKEEVLAALGKELNPLNYFFTTFDDPDTDDHTISIRIKWDLDSINSVKFCNETT